MNRYRSWMRRIISSVSQPEQAGQLGAGAEFETGCVGLFLIEVRSSFRWCARLLLWSRSRQFEQKWREEALKPPNHSSVSFQPHYGVLHCPTAPPPILPSFPLPTSYFLDPSINQYFISSSMIPSRPLQAPPSPCHRLIILQLFLRPREVG